MRDSTVYNWLPCRVCKCYHRGEVVRSGGQGANWLVDACIECPDHPRKGAPYYRAVEWVQGTQDQIEHLPALR